MTNERLFYIAYRVVKYIRESNREQFEDYLFCMYVHDLAVNITSAINNNDVSYLDPYYYVLDKELKCVCNEKDKTELKELISLLDSCMELLDDCME